MSIAKKECDRCAFWEPDDDRLIGECRRYAPGPKHRDWDDDASARFTSNWPTTFDEDWCGEFKIKDEESQAMTNEQVWSESTVMERCEILKSRLDLMEQAQLDWITSEPGWTVTKDELARLRRIEEAATRLLSEAWTDGGGLSKVDGRFVDMLRGAIWREATER